MARRKKNKKPIIIAVCVVAFLIVALIVGLVLTNDKNTGKASVQSVAQITSSGVSTGASNVYAGVVESQKSVNVNANTAYKIAETYVKVGSNVKAGDKLFSYDMSENAMSARQAQLDIEKLRNNAAALQEELYQLMEEREEASSSEKSTYSVQILQKQNEIKQNSYDIESKQLELSKLQDEASEATVSAPISGVVKEIKDLDSESATNTYIVIMATGDYRIQGVINEQNIDEIKLGQKMLIHSRTDESKVWRGRISEIDKDNPIYKNENNPTASTNYAFYVTLDSVTDLMLGEHIYIEKDLGLTKDGKIQLPSYYIVDAQTKKPYVMAEKDGKIAKQYVVLGELNKDTNCYVIAEGLTLNDNIAYPDATVKIGMEVIKESKNDN